MRSTRFISIPPAGYSFRISELIMLKAWAQDHDLGMAVELDYCVDGEDYEEVVTFISFGGRSRKLMVWRAPGQIVVQPLIGRPRRFSSVPEALDYMVATSGKRPPVASPYREPDLYGPEPGLAA